jgi:hypothetical protein
MTTALVWKKDVNTGVYTARKLNAVRGQYLIGRGRTRDGVHYDVWHRTLNRTTWATSDRFIGAADTLESAKAITQAHADQYGREKAAA